MKGSPRRARYTPNGSSWAPAFGTLTEKDDPGRPLVQARPEAGGDEEFKYLVDFQPSRVYAVAKHGLAPRCVLMVACAAAANAP